MYKKKIMIGVIGALCSFSLFTLNVNAATSYRIWGQNRVQTSVEIADEGMSNSDYAIIAYAWDFPDAISAAPLAYKYEAPILLTEKESLSSNIDDELTSLKVKHVIIVGGTGVISANVEAQIKAKGIDIQRLSGENRYETSIAIANQVGLKNEIVVTNGLNFGEALSISPIAAKKGMPIILTEKDNVPKAVSDYLAENQITKTYILGKADGVSSDDGVADNSVFPNQVRITGNNIYERNINIINTFKDDIDFSKIYVATSRSFADALAGAPLAANTSSPIIFVDSNMPQTTKDFIQSEANSIDTINALGGGSAVSDDMLKSLINDTETVPGETTTDTSDNGTVNNYIEISSIDNINTSTEVGSNYILPAKVLANTKDGLTVNIPVTWNPATINTSISGNYSFTGVAHYYDAISDSIKDFASPVTLTVTVK